MVLPLSITTDFRDDGGPIQPRLELFAEIGFTHIHWCEHWSRDVLYEDFYMEGVGRALQRTGLKLLDTHNAEASGASPSAPEEEARRRGVRLLQNRIRFTAALGGDCVVVHPGPFETSDPATFGRRWENLERSLSAAASLCEQMKVRMALENMAKPMPQVFHALMRKFPSEILGFCFDSGHANLAGEPELAGNFSTRLAALHLHDNHGQKDEHAIPGQGTVDWERVAGALKGCAYSKPLNFELSLRDEAADPRAFLIVAHHKAVEVARKVAEAPVMSRPEA